MIAFLGVIVGGIVIAMYLPIFDLISKLTAKQQKLPDQSELLGAGSWSWKLATDNWNDRLQPATKLLWLIAGRAAVITLLLGSAMLIRIKVPGAFPINPFFVLIGITYALTAVYGSTLQVLRAPQLARRRAAGVRRGDRVGDRLHHRRRVELLLVALHAADHRREHDPVAPRRHDGRRS